MRREQRLLVELSFDRLGYTKVPKAAELLLDCFKRSICAKNIKLGRADLFFSSRRIVLWTCIIDCEQSVELMQDQVRELCTTVLTLFLSACKECRDTVSNILILLSTEFLLIQAGEMSSTPYTFISGADKQFIDSTEMYWQYMEANHVLIDNRIREKHLRKLLSSGAEGFGGEICPDSLFNQVLLTVEQPVSVPIWIEQEYLTLPRELLFTVLRKNNVFPVLKGKLLTNGGIQIADGSKADLKARQATVSDSLARVARLFAQDLNKPRSQWQRLMELTPYYKGMGSLAHKQLRLQKISQTIIELLDAGSKVCEVAGSAALLCKYDTVSEVCSLYPEMKGVISEVLALEQGESEMVGQAIREHLLPGSGTRQLPHTLAGAVLGIADRVDDVCGHYYTSGTSIGAYRSVRQLFDQIILIADSVSLDISFPSLLKFALSQYESQGLVSWRGRDLVHLLKIFWNRIGEFLLAKGYTPDLTNALVAAKPESICAVRETAVTLSRHDNLVRVADCQVTAQILENFCPRGYNYDEAAREFLELPEEKELFELFLSLQPEVEAAQLEHRFQQALISLARLRGPLERLVEKPGFKCDDLPLYMNRLSLLNEIRDLMCLLADFSLLKKHYC